MAATINRRPRVYTLKENMLRAIRRAGLDGIPYRTDILPKTGRVRQIQPVFDPATMEDVRRVMSERFIYRISY